MEFNRIQPKTASVLVRKCCMFRKKLDKAVKYFDLSPNTIDLSLQKCLTDPTRPVCTRQQMSDG
jgi:hypothetical protein